MRIHLHCCTRNEMRILPYFFRHYNQFIEKYFIRDYGSIDNTKELCKSNSKVHLVELQDSLVDEEQLTKEKNYGWKEFSNVNNCDWVIPCDPDEFLYHPDLLNILDRYMKEGINFPKIQGYQMFSEKLPTINGQIYDEIKTGVEAENYSKFMIFHPSINPNYSYGCHFANPTGPNIKISETRELKILHYKVFGGVFVEETMFKVNNRLSNFNKIHGMGVYKLDPNYPFNPEKELNQLRNTYKVVI